MPKTRRKWATCPNCSTLLRPDDNFCPNCGQENHDLNVPLRKLLPEVLENLAPIGITSVNGKFWHSMRAVFTRPGQITADFLAGRRARYVPPIRLYIWVSLVFFLILGQLSNKGLRSQKPIMNFSGTIGSSATLDELVDEDTLEQLGLDGVAGVELKLPTAQTAASGLLKRLRQPTASQIDSLLKSSKLGLTGSNRVQLRQALALLPTKLPPPEVMSMGVSTKGGGFRDIRFLTDSARLAFGQQVGQMTTNQLDSVVSHHGGEPGWLNRQLLQRAARMTQFKTLAEGTQAITTAFLKNLSGVMFLLMPFVAALLWLFYARRKQYRRHYYEHLIFSIHIHTVLFLLAGLVLGMVYFLTDNTLTEQLLQGLGWVCWLYFLLALKHVYRQSWLRTGMKWLLISLVYGLTLSLFMVIAIIAGLMTV
jgi:hypothetical protein